jgi:hypothetical protein
MSTITLPKGDRMDDKIGYLREKRHRLIRLMLENYGKLPLVPTAEYYTIWQRNAELQDAISEVENEIKELEYGKVHEIC